MWVSMPAIMVVVAGAFVMFVANLMANRQHVKRLQKSGAVSRLLDASTEVLLMIASPCRNIMLCSAI
jgi:hypothetical protein